MLCPLVNEVMWFEVRVTLGLTSLLCVSQIQTQRATEMLAVEIFVDDAAQECITGKARSSLYDALRMEQWQFLFCRWVNSDPNWWEGVRIQFLNMQAFNLLNEKSVSANVKQNLSLASILKERVWSLRTICSK